MSHQTDPKDEKLSALLQLKRFEQPDIGYFDRFAEEFRASEDSQLVKESAMGSMVARFKGMIERIESRPRLAFGSALAYAAIAMVAVVGIQVGSAPSVQGDNELLISPVSLQAPTQIVIPVVENVSKSELKRIEAVKAEAESELAK